MLYQFFLRRNSSIDLSSVVGRSLMNRPSRYSALVFVSVYHSATPSVPLSTTVNNPSSTPSTYACASRYAESSTFRYLDVASIIMAWGCLLPRTAPMLSLPRPQLSHFLGPFGLKVRVGMGKHANSTQIYCGPEAADRAGLL